MKIILICGNTDIFHSGEKRHIISKDLSIWQEIFGKIIYVNKNKGPKTEPCGTTPASTGTHDVWQIKTTLWNVFSKKIYINLRSIPFIPLHFRPLVCESLLSIVFFPNIIMWKVGIIFLVFLGCFAACAKVIVKSIYFCIMLKKGTFKVVCVFLLFKARNLKIFNTANHN